MSFEKYKVEDHRDHGPKSFMLHGTISILRVAGGVLFLILVFVTFLIFKMKLPEMSSRFHAAVTVLKFSV